MPMPKPKEHDPNQAVREMEEIANAQRSSTKDAREMEGLDKTSRKVPRTAPDDLMGTPEYYKWRAEEFKKRHPDEEPPAYLMDYGYKYAKIFRDEIRPELTDNGKEWLDKTMLGLQQRLEQAYKDGTLDEMNPEAFHDYATGIHAEEYLKNGFRWLHPNDYLTIMGRMAQEPKDFVMAIPEMMESAPWVVTSGEARNLQGIYEDLKEWKQNKKEGEQIPLHILLRSMPPVQPF